MDWALAHDAVILFDSAYEAFIQDGELPTSIYQIDGAKRCAIEFCSLSKTAGFTGVRCGYTVVPHELIQGGVSLNELWLRRQSTKFNGVSYVTQRGAEAAFTPEGLEQNRTSILYYLENARLIADALTELGIWFTGGSNAPYIWLQCPRTRALGTSLPSCWTAAASWERPVLGSGAMAKGSSALRPLPAERMYGAPWIA